MAQFKSITEEHIRFDHKGAEVFLEKDKVVDLDETTDYIKGLIEFGKIELVISKASKNENK